MKCTIYTVKQENVLEVLGKIKKKILKERRTIEDVEDRTPLQTNQSGAMS